MPHTRSAAKRLRNMLMEELLRQARQNLVDGLREHATYWPTDLFNPPPKPADPADTRDAVSGPPAEAAPAPPVAPTPGGPAPNPDVPPPPDSPPPATGPR